MECMNTVKGERKTVDRAKSLADTEKSFAQLEEDTAKWHPGVMEIMRVYGNCEAAIRQADGYLSALNSRLQYTTSNRSSR